MQELVDKELEFVMEILDLKLQNAYNAIVERFGQIDFTKKTLAKKQTKNSQNHIKVYSDFAMIYATTARSQLYLESMCEIGFLPQVFIVLSEQNCIDSKLNTLAKTHNLTIKPINQKDINSEKVKQEVLNLTQKYIIYSGFGGGILDESYFLSDKSFIHIHAGEPPTYRGSTTCYYSLLQDKSISASAMFLSPLLDCGEIIATSKFDLEQIYSFGSFDIDNFIEPCIRANALQKALLSFMQNGAFESRANTQKHYPYYRIHPTLKHIAILSCFEGGNL